MNFERKNNFKPKIVEIKNKFSPQEWKGENINNKKF